MRNVLQDDGLHGQHVGKLHLRDVQSTHNVGPPWGSKGRAVLNVLQPSRALCSHRAADRHGRERRKRIQEGSQLELDIRFETVLVVTWLGIRAFVGERWADTKGKAPCSTQCPSKHPVDS